MNATVNESCIGCGLCAGTCPEVFSMGDDGFAHGGDVPAELLDQAQEARDGCPVSAISIVKPVKKVRKTFLTGFTTPRFSDCPAA